MYTINEDGTVTRNAGANSSSPQSSGGSDDNFGCWVLFIIVIVVGIVVFALANKNSSIKEVPVGPAYAEEANDVDTYISTLVSVKISRNADV